MKPEMILFRNLQIADRLRRLPRKMLQLHGMDNVTDFVLHELCSTNCFNIPKAAYFIDNPAFNCLKGVVGVSDVELQGMGDIWASPDYFIQTISQSPFNQKVRSFACESRKNRGHSEEDMAKVIADELGLKDYGFYSWDMKHDNHGFLVCEKNNNQEIDHPQEDVMVDGLCLLSFCPVY
ncbi:MAG TPA: hypothetical protein VLB80_01425 [Candidatus Babeliales bacterium]|nr:hypothetical protein [Candidatus Babeliales bacterium]